MFSREMEAYPREMAILTWLLVIMLGYTTVARKTSNDLEPSYCPDCANIKSEVNDLDLAELRIEFIKQQILRKLKLKEVPKVSLPANGLIPLLTHDMYQNVVNRSTHDQDMQEDDFFGKTNQVILFPENTSHCEDMHLPPSKLPVACFTFNLPKDFEMEDVSEAYLWVYKTKDFLDINHTFVYNKVDSRRPGLKTEVSFLRSHVTAIKEGWIKLDFVEIIREWLELITRRYTIQVVCETCGFRAPTTPVGVESAKQPFLSIKTETNRKRRRPKRNVNCIPGISECCREKLYVSFADIGWDDWIIQPRGYEAYFCRGSCSNAASLTLSGTAYSSMIRKLIQLGKKIELAPCCTATHLSSIQLIFMYDNNTITQKTLPNMSIESCGCM